MDTTLDLSRWREKPHGINYRRWTIVSTGLRQLTGTRYFRILLFLGWIAGVVLAALAFFFSQSVASGGWLETYAGEINIRLKAIASALGALVLLYPDICIHGVYTLLFWLQSFVGLTLSLFALTAVVPRLVTRDRASNALTIYLSRPLTSRDYLLGKLGIIVGILALLWTGPLLVGWLLSMLLAPNRDFIVYSFSPLLRALLFNGIGLVVLAAIALGASALTRSSRNTIILWIGLWIVGGALAKMPHAPDWLRHASFSYNLSQVRQNVFRLDDALSAAGAQLPFIDADLARKLSRAGTKAQPINFNGALVGLGVLVTISSFVFLRKLRPE